jgi:hypothetical protein
VTHDRFQHFGPPKRDSVIASRIEFRRHSPVASTHQYEVILFVVDLPNDRRG